MKARKQWQDKNNQKLYIQRLRNNMWSLLKESVGVGAMLLMKAVIMLETIFEGEYADE